jgi:endonuclease/exonuclease/phosphatase (EEP) superfamily protein YafD
MNDINQLDFQVKRSSETDLLLMLMLSASSFAVFILLVILPENNNWIAISIAALCTLGTLAVAGYLHSERTAFQALLASYQYRSPWQPYKGQRPAASVVNVILKDARKQWSVPSDAVSWDDVITFMVVR